ncbi:hypothetical protein PR048_022186 [Dryococelus australis]|uniref:HAT C-terminal dimerisation domain-containing protein n=1 Tax=Dryococelus australis TaxID=614101 RepID=A0ABQ9H0J4_9NEOP|nr:hypothetical protein PR048_022186 [Dryococelus australis]
MRQDKVVAIVRDNAANVTSAVQKLEICGIPCTAHTIQLIIIERFLEQKSAVSLCSSELNLSTTLASCDWNTIGNIEPIVTLFAEVTKTVSKSSCSISEVIPILNSFRWVIKRDKAMGLQNMKNYIIYHLDAYYPIEATETKKFYALATCLNPRFKNNVSSKRNANTAVNMPTEEAKTNCNQSSSADCHDDSDNSICSLRRKKPDFSLKTFQLMLLEENKNTFDVSLLLQSPPKVEVKNYLDEPLTPDEDTVFQYWETVPYTILKRLASKYLCVPAGNITSELLFSTCGSFLNNRRCF